MRYDAFISYRHTEPDMFVAKKLHKSLETFHVPRTIRKKTGKKSVKRVFRDQDELPIGSDLGDNIIEALKESEYLIVICSPRTPQSEWVQREIEAFIKLHDREHVLAVLIEGEPSDSFPKILLQDEYGKAVEPLAADIRGKNQKSMARKLKEELLRLLAPLLGCTYDDLRQRHKERKMKKIFAVTLAVAFLGILFGLYNAYNTMLIRQNFEQKQINQSKYLANKSLELLESGDRQAAALVALEALPNEENERPYVALAQLALTEAVHAYDTGNVMGMDRVLKHDLPVSYFRYDKEGTKLASVDQGESVYVWDLETGEKLLQLLPELDENGYVEDVLQVIPFEDRLILVEAEEIRCITLDGEELWKKIPEGEVSLSGCEYDFDDEIFICQSGDLVCIYDMRTGNVLHRIQNRCEHDFSMEIEYSSEFKRCAVSHIIMGEEATKGCVTVYDLQKRQQKDYEIIADYVHEIVFAPDGDLVVASSGADSVLSGQDTCDAHIEKIDISTGKVEWENAFEYLFFGTEAASTQLKARGYRDAFGEMQNEIVMSIDNGAYTYDSETGKEISAIHMSTGIRALSVSKDTYFGYITEASGNIHIVNTTDGTNYGSAVIETGKDVSQLEIKNSTIAIREKYSPELTIMKYHEGYGIKELETYEDTVEAVSYTEDEMYYAVETYVDSYTRNIYFYQTDKDKKVGEWKCSGEGILAGGRFLDSETYCVFDGEGRLLFYDIFKNKETELLLFEDLRMSDYYVTQNGKYLLAYESKNYTVVDLSKRKKVFNGEFAYYFHGGILSEDADYIYGNLKNAGVVKIKTASGEMTTLFDDEILENEENTDEIEILTTPENQTEERKTDLEKYRMITNYKNGHGLALSSDDRYLAVSCKDFVLRVLDLKKLQTVAEIPYAGISRCFLQFMPDGNQILLQGDDYYIRVYDIQKKDFVYMGMTQNNIIDKMVYYEKQQKICIQTSNEMLLLQAKDYQPIIEEEKATGYMPMSGSVFAKYGGTLYRFPYMTLEMLYQEAKEQFGDAELTQTERIRYAMDNEGDL